MLFEKGNYIWLLQKWDRLVTAVHWMWSNLRVTRTQALGIGWRFKLTGVGAQAGMITLLCLTNKMGLTIKCKPLVAAAAAEVDD